MFRGLFETFTFVPETDTNINEIVAKGTIYGVTRAFTPAGATGVAYIPEVPVYVMTIDALSAAGTAGDGVYVDDEGELTLSATRTVGQETVNNQKIGFLWENATSGATEIIVAWK